MPAPAAHELNASFEWDEHRGPFRAVTAAQARQYDEDGFFVLEDALGASEVDALDRGHRSLRGTRGRRAARAGGRAFLHRPRRRDHLHDPPGAAVARVAGVHTLPAADRVCADLIGPDVRLYWDQAVYKKPGTESPFPWHQDNGYAFVEPQQYLTCWVALTDATEENGCPWVVPRLHRRGTLAHQYSDIGFVCLRDPADAVAVPVRAGSIVVFSSLTPHSTGPNRTDEVRKAYIVQYAPDGAAVLRPEPGGATKRAGRRRGPPVRGAARGAARHALGAAHVAFGAPAAPAGPPPGPPLPICGGRPMMTVVAVTVPSLSLVPCTPTKSPTLSADALDVVPPLGPGFALELRARRETTVTVSWRSSPR